MQSEPLDIIGLPRQPTNCREDRWANTDDWTGQMPPPQKQSETVRLVVLQVVSGTGVLGSGSAPPLTGHGTSDKFVAFQNGGNVPSSQSCMRIKRDNT